MANNRQSLFKASAAAAQCSISTEMEHLKIIILNASVPIDTPAVKRTIFLTGLLFTQV